MAEFRAVQTRDGIGGQKRLCVEDVRGWQLWQVGCGPGGETALARQLVSAGAGELPSTGAPVSVRADMRLYALAPRTWWWLAPDDAPIGVFAAGLDPAVVSLTPLSAARVRIALAGPDASALLQKGIAIDLHPRVFPVGRAVFTALDHVGVMLERTAEDRWELFVPTTWSVSVREWLADAARPFLQAQVPERTGPAP